MTALAWIGLAGPTASGKSAIALALAERVPLEIVSVDSALVYRGMDIGTAKPSVAERAAVPHHLIDLIDPREAYSAAQFAADATRLIDEIHAPRPAAAAGRRHDAVLQDPERRARRAARRRPGRARCAGSRGLRARLAGAARRTRTHRPGQRRALPPTDAQRIGRALEVFRISGRTLSSFHTAPRCGAAAGADRARAAVARLAA